MELTISGEVIDTLGTALICKKIKKAPGTYFPDTLFSASILKNFLQLNFNPNVYFKLSRDPRCRMRHSLMPKDYYCRIELLPRSF